MWFVPEEQRELTPYRYHAGYKPSLVKSLEILVIHFTATPWNGDREGSNESRQRQWLRGERSETSTHFDILRDGYALQGASTEDRTWHSGGSKYVNGDWVITQTNMHSVGIDLDNVGELYSYKEEFVDYYGREAIKRGETPRFYRGPEPVTVFIDGKKRYWEPHTKKAIKSLLHLLVQLKREYPQFVGRPDRIVGHEHIRSTKSDPGPVFPWPWVAAAVQPAFDEQTIENMDFSEIPFLI